MKMFKRKSFMVNAKTASIPVEEVERILNSVLKEELWELKERVRTLEKRMNSVHADVFR